MATLAFWTGGYGSGDFVLSTGGNGDTLITTTYANSLWNNSSGDWNTASAWSTGAVPGVNDTAEIGNGNGDTFTVTTGSGTQTIASLMMGDPHATLQVTNALTVQPQAIELLAGTLEVTGTASVTAPGLLIDSSSASLLMDPGSVVNLSGHSNYGLENAGTIAVPSNNPFAISITGNSTIDGGTLNAGPGAGGGTGGALYLSHTSGGTPTSLLVQAGAQVTDTYSMLSSNPFDFASLTIDGSTWNDAGDPTDGGTTRGYMLVGHNELGGSEPIAGAATLTLQNHATLTEASRAIIGDNANSSGSVVVDSSSVWDVATATGGFLEVGSQGNGALTISNGGTVEVGNTGTFVSNGSTLTGGGIGIARHTGSTGTVTVESGGLLSSLGGLSVGRGGQGSLNVLSGGTVSLSNLGVGYNTGGSATVTVSGSGADLVVQTGGYVGVSAAGAIMNVASSAVATLGTLQLGLGGSGQGTLTAGTGGHIAITSNAGIANGSMLVVSDGTSGVDIGTSGTYVGGAVNVESGHTLSGVGVIAGAVQNSGQIQAVSGTLEVTGSITSAGSGTLAVGDDAVLRLDGSVDAGQIISMGTGSELILNAPGSVISNAISNLSVGDEIELNFGTNVSISNVSASGNTVTITASNGTYQLTNVSYAGGTPAQFTYGADAVTGNDYIQVQAAGDDWTGIGADTSYSTPGNWGSGVPTSTTAVSFVNNAGTVTGGGNALSIAIGTYGSTYSGAWTFANGSIVVSGQPNLGSLSYAAGFYGNAVLNAETLNAAGGTIEIGGPGSVTVTAEGGSQVTTAGDVVGNAGGQIGSLLLTGAGTDWIEQTGSAINGNLPGFMVLGGALGASGALTVTDGASLSTGASATLGNVAGGSGSATVSAGGVWTASGGMTVGNGGSGSLTVNGGTLTTGAYSVIGSAVGSSGSVHVTGQGLLTNTGGLEVGGGGAGTLTVDGNSAVTSTGYLTLGDLSGGVGIANVTSATVSVLGAQIGNVAAGTLTVGSGGTVTASGTYSAVGSNAGGSGALIVNGNGLFQVGSTSTATTTFQVGSNPGSSGSVVINAGGTIDFINSGQTAAPVMFIGRAGDSASEPGASGSVLVTGGGALLNTNGQAMAVGNNAGAQGNLVVEQGGSVAVGTPDDNQIYSLGIANSGGSGAVTVTDAGSTLSSAGYLLDGRGGSGSLTVENNGLVVVTDASNGGGVGIGAGRGLGPSQPTNVGGDGSAVVTTGGTLEVNSSTYGISVGGNGVNGSLTVNTGGKVLAGTGMTVGSATAANGTTYGGTGQLYIGAGGTVQASHPGAYTYAIVVGGANGSIGDVTSGSATGAASGAAVISGTGALLDANGEGVAIGWLSTGSMTISQGGSVVSGSPDDTYLNALSIGRRAAGSLTITDAGSSYNVQGIAYVGRAGNGSLLIENGGTLTSTNDAKGYSGIAIGGTGGDGISTYGTVTYLMTGGSGTALLTSGGSMSSQQGIVVGTQGVDGTLTIQNGSTAEAGTQIVIGDSVLVANGDTIITPNQSLVVNTTGGSLVAGSGAVNVGAGGTLQAAGAHVQGVAGIVVGAGANSSGLLNVRGAYVPTITATTGPLFASGTTLGTPILPATVVDTGGDNLVVGQTGQGQMVVTLGAEVTAGTQFATDSAVTVGQNLGASGNVQVSEKGVLTAKGELDVGNTGSGSLLVQNAGSVTSGGALYLNSGLEIGRNSGGSGTVTVTGPGSVLNNSGQLVVGDAGTGSFAVQNFATATTDPLSAGVAAAVIANQAGSDGSSVTVSGIGSDWQVGGTLQVGNAASGSLAVVAGGTVTAAAAEVGVQSGGAGNMMLSGTSSSLSLTGTMSVGMGGAGELSVLNGANLTIGGDLNVGQTAGDSGNVDFEGNGTIVIGANLNMGAGGPAVLTVGPNTTVMLDNGGINGGPNSILNLYNTIDPFYISNSTANIRNSGTQNYPAYVNSTAFNLTDGITYALDTPTIYGNSNFAIGTGSGTVATTLILNADSVSNTTTISFDNGLGTLDLGIDQLATIEVPPSGSSFTAETNPNLGVALIGGFQGVVSNYQTGDQIVVEGEWGGSAVYSGGSVIAVVENSNTVGSIAFDSTAHAAAAYSDNAVAVTCFAAGTRIRTARGDSAVEDLREGDHVWSVISEQFEPVQWIGYRAVNCRAHPRPEKVWPVVVSAGAFGPGLPVRDLVMSPDHAVYVNAVLIPVKLLANGTTIQQVPADTVTYYHVELPAHDVLLAEGLPAKSYLDVDDRSSFTNGGGPVALHPDFAARRWELRWEAEACAPFYVVGPAVEAARAMLAAPAGKARRAAA